MIRSMTAFARVEQQENWGHICWELRSVNHRYLDLSIRLPDEFHNLETSIQERIQKTLHRGKLNCTLYFQPNTVDAMQLHINEVLLQQLWEAVKNIHRLTGTNPTVDTMGILHWPGILESRTLDLTEIGDTVLLLLDEGLIQLIGHREREGTQLSALLIQRCDAIAGEVVQIRQQLPTILNSQRERLSSRLSELVELNSERVEQEMVILAQKMDISEELERLEAHLHEIRQTLAKGTSAGRRLDFLVQELHREANTLSAKANHINTTRSAVELKVLIEQMREQTQNIE